jgi:serine protease
VDGDGLDRQFEEQDQDRDRRCRVQAVVNGDMPPAKVSTVTMFGGPEDPGPDEDPWHGTEVASAAAAIPNNARGAAGPAGPVSDLSLVRVSLDIFAGMTGLN